MRDAYTMEEMTDRYQGAPVMVIRPEVGGQEERDFADVPFEIAVFRVPDAKAVGPMCSGIVCLHRYSETGLWHYNGQDRHVIRYLMDHPETIVRAGSRRKRRANQGGVAT